MPFDHLRAAGFAWRHTALLFLPTVGLAQHKAAGKPGPPAKPERPVYAFAVHGDLSLHPEFRAAARETVDATGNMFFATSGLIGYETAERRFDLMNKLHPPETAGEEVLSWAMLNFYVAKMENARTEADIAKSIRDLEDQSPKSRDDLQGYLNQRFKTDPVALDIAAREKDCAEALRKALAQEQAPERIESCEFATVDPSREDYVRSTLPATLTNAPRPEPGSHQFSPLFQEVDRNALTAIDMLQIGEWGTYGWKAVDHWTDFAAATRATEGDRLLLQATLSYAALRADWLQAIFVNFARQMERGIHTRGFRLDEDTENRALNDLEARPELKALESRASHCDDAIRAATAAGELAANLEACPVVAAKKPATAPKGRRSTR